MAYILYRPTGGQKQAADAKESWASYIPRNVAQVPGRVATGVLGFPGDVMQAFGRDIGANKRLKVPREIEENPFLLPGYLEKLREEKQPYQFEEVAPGIGSQQLQQLLPEYLRPREGDYLGEALSYMAPFGITPALKGLNLLRSGAFQSTPGLAKALIGGLTKSGIMGAGAYGGSQLGATAGKGIGESIGLPETGETLGGAVGFGLGSRAAAKGLAYLQEPPTKLIRAADKEGKKALERAHVEYEAKIDAAEAEFKNNERALANKKQELQVEHEQRLRNIEQQREQLEQSIVNTEERLKNNIDSLENAHQDLVVKLQQEADALPDRVEQMLVESEGLYDLTENILNEKYQGDLKVEVPNFKERIEEAQKEGFKSTAKNVKTATQFMVDDLLDDIKNGKMSIRDAKLHLTNLGRRGFQSGEAPIIKSVAKSMRKILHESIFDSLQQHPDLRQSWLEANKMYQEASNLDTSIPRMEREFKKQVGRSAQQMKYKKGKLAREHKGQQDAIKRAIRDLGKGVGELDLSAIEQEVGRAKEKMAREKTLAARELARQKRSAAGDVRGSQAEQILRAGVRRFGLQSLGATFAGVVASALGIPGGLRQLATLGGGAVGYSARIWKQVRSIAKTNPDLYIKYKSAVNEAYKGNLGPLANVTQLIGAELGQKRKK